MLSLDKRTSVDLLIEQFWKQGYLTLSRKFGTYLPEPSRVGMFDVDVIARQKKIMPLELLLRKKILKTPPCLKRLFTWQAGTQNFQIKKYCCLLGFPKTGLKWLKKYLRQLNRQLRKT